MKRWMVAWVLAGLAALAWGHAVLRLVQAHARPSAARLVHFVIDGKPSEIDANCHGTALVAGDSIWQVCSEFQGNHKEWLTRFDLRVGIGERHTVEGGVGALMGAALHADGTLALATYKGLFVVRDNRLELVSTRDTTYFGVAWRGDALEVVDYDVIRSYRRGDSGWTSSSRPVPRPAYDHMKQDRDFATAYPTAVGWRFVFTLLTEPLPATGPIPVEVIETAEAAPLRSLGVLQLEAPFANRIDSDPTKGWVRNLIDTTAGGVFQSGPFRYVVAANKLVPPAPGPPGPPSHGAEYGYNYDYEVRPGVLVPIPELRVGDHSIRIGGRWIRHDYENDASLLDLTNGTRGPMITNVFWLEPGFKILTATDGGMWVMGSLGEAYLKIDQSLARTDHLTLAERLARLRVFDRAKRNSDFYLTWRRQVAVPLVLLWFPAFVVPMLLYGLAVRRSERWGPPARVALLVTALGYLLVRLLFYGPYNDLTGRFYS